MRLEVIRVLIAAAWGGVVMWLLALGLLVLDSTAFGPLSPHIEVLPLVVFVCLTALLYTHDRMRGEALSLLELPLRILNRVEQAKR